MIFSLEQRRMEATERQATIATVSRFIDLPLPARCAPPWWCCGLVVGCSALRSTGLASSPPTATSFATAAPRNPAVPVQYLLREITELSYQAHSGPGQLPS